MLEKMEMRYSFSCFGGHALYAALLFTIFTIVFILFDPVSVVNTNEDGSASVHYPEVDSGGIQGSQLHSAKPNTVNDLESAEHNIVASAAKKLRMQMCGCNLASEEG
jgi:hypothetical protein